MRTTAKVDIVITCVINRNSLICRQIDDKFCLELLILEELQCLILGDDLTCPVFSPLDDLVHLFFNCREILFCDRSRKDEIIIASVFDLRSDRVLYLFAVDLDNSLSQDVCKRVTVHLQYFFFFHCKKPPLEFYAQNRCADSRRLYHK